MWPRGNAFLESSQSLSAQAKLACLPFTASPLICIRVFPAFPSQHRRDNMRRTTLAFAALTSAITLQALPACAYEIDPLTRMPLTVLDPMAVPQATAIPRQVVPYAGRHATGTIIIATTERRLYFVLGNGQAIQYGVGVGRPGFEWSGTKTVTNKREWPDWTPPPQMLRRRPDLPRHMKGGPDNPLGARAMYLGGSLYRIHGSNEPDTIGQAVSSGCIRMLNEDVVDLYERVRIGTRVVVQR
jgi:lipoprotein-anchoring transpeptidase ErfK/SrfK